MTGNLDEALLALLRAALPSLLGGAAPPVAVAAVPAAFVLDAASADVEAGQARSDSASDLLPFAQATPAGPYLLSRPPDLSLRKLRLATAAGDRIPLHDSEVLWDALEPRRFSLALRPGRDLAGITGVLVLYGVTAVYATLGYTQELSLSFSSAVPADLERAQALAMAVLALHRAGLVADGAKTEQADAYRALIGVQALHILGGDAPSATQRRIQLRAEITLKGVRALAEGEGAPIQRLLSPGSPGGRPIDIQVQVGA
jgi:hypothetical protein